MVAHLRVGRGIPVAVALTILAALAGEVVLSVWTTMAAILAITAMAFGLRRYQPSDKSPWLLLMASVGLFMLAAIVSELSGPSSGYPALSDWIDLVAYGTTVTGYFRLARYRYHRADPTVLIDSLILTSGVGVVIWTLVVHPSLVAGDLTVGGRVLNLAFTALSLTVLALGSRVWLTPGRRPRPFYLIAIAAVSALGSDIVSAIKLTHDWTGLVTIVTATATVGFFALAGAALDPKMDQLTRPGAAPVASVSRVRVLLMLGASVCAPVIVAIRLPSATRAELIVAIVFWCTTMVLVIVRLGGLVRAHEQLAVSNRILAEANASLATATAIEEMYLAASHAALQLAANDRSTRASVLIADGASWRVETALGAGSAMVVGFRASGDAVAHRLDPDHRILASSAAIDHPTETAAWSVVVPLGDPAAPEGLLMLSRSAPMPESTLTSLERLASNLALSLESARLNAEIHAQQTERRFRSLIERSSDIVVVVDDDGLISFASPAALPLLGRTEVELLGRPVLGLATPASQRAVAGVLAGRAHDGEEVELLHADGTPRWFEIVMTDLSDDPDIEARVVNAREIGRRKRVEQQLARSEARFRSLVQHSSDVVAVLDDELRFQWVSPSIEPVLGYQPAALLDNELASLVESASKLELARVLYRLEVSDGEPQTSELRIMSNFGEMKTLDATITDLRDEPAVGGLVLNANDITDRKLLEDQLRHQALHDDLTGLPNRLLFRDRLEQSLHRRNGAEMAVIMVDLDEFKTVNDSLGHECGDELLKVIAFRLRQFLRRGDTAARLGGDEFGIVIDDVDDRAVVLDVADRLRAVLHEPVVLNEREVRATASVGVAFSEDVPDPTAEAVLRSVDTAVYAAKSQGKDRVLVFDAAMHAGVFERLELRADLAGAVAHQQFVLHYQPIVDLPSRQVMGFEALVRWEHPDRGLVSPGSFIQLAEETGLIVPIGEWLLTTALRQLRHWQRTVDPAFTMSINLSPRQLAEATIVERIAEAVTSAGVNPATVGFELTESMDVDDDLLAERLARIGELGVGLYADDFGSGYASYAALQRHPFTTVKIDRSLIQGLDGNDNTRALAQVKSIIDMAHGVQMTVVAEGIETSTQAELLTAVGCDRGQGFYFARPAPPAAVELPVIRATGRTHTPL